MPFAPPSGISLSQIASNGLRFTDLYSSSDRFQLTSIQWDGDVYDLPREMLWDLPSQYLLTNYSKVPTPVYNLDGSLEEVQEVVDGVLDRMEEGYSVVIGTALTDGDVKKTASQDLQSQSSLVLSPLMTHSSTMRRATAANGEQASTDARQDDADRSPSQSPVGNQMDVYFASGTEASAETSAQVSTRGEREETEPKSPAVARLIPGTARSLTQEDATPLALDSVTQSPPVNDSITPGDDATSSDDGSPPSGVIITPPLPATETGPDDPLIAYYNGDPTAVDEDDETEAISVKPGTIKTLASLYPSESTIQAGSEDGEYELVDEDLDLQGRETIAWHPRLINIEGTQETMTPFDSKDINDLAGLKVDKPSLPTDEATAAPSAVQQAREDAANAISEGSPPELAPSSPYPYHSSPTPAPRTPTKRRRNKRLQNSMRSMLDDDHELESFPHAAREVQPGSTASVVEGHEDRASLSRTPAEQAHEGSNLDLLSAVAKRERYQKCIDSAHTPQSLPLPDFSHNAEEKKRLSGGKESWRPSQVELNKPDIKVTESKLEVYVEEWSKDDKRGILADPDKLAQLPLSILVKSLMTNSQTLLPHGLLPFREDGGRRPRKRQGQSDEAVQATKSSPVKKARGFVPPAPKAKTPSISNITDSHSNSQRGNAASRVIKLSWKPRVIPLAYKPEADDPWQPNDHLGNAKKMKMSHLKTAGTSKPSNGMAKKIESPRVRSPSPPLDRAASEDPIASMEIDDGEIQVAVSSRTRGNDKVGFKATRAESRRVCAAFGYTDEEDEIIRSFSNGRTKVQREALEDCAAALVEAGFPVRSVNALKFRCSKRGPLGHPEDGLTKQGGSDKRNATGMASSEEPGETTDDEDSEDE